MIRERRAATLSGVSDTASPARQAGRAALVFAALSVLVALAAGGLYLFRRVDKPPSLTPEETVSAFLSAVFLSADPQKASPLVCSNWDPADAIARTTAAVPDGASVSWGELKVVTSAESRVTVRGSLGVRMPDDSRPSSFAQWRFTLVDEDGWRVCEARPLAT